MLFSLFEIHAVSCTDLGAPKAQLQQATAGVSLRTELEQRRRAVDILA
ncbi:hypothetical protein [Ferrovibrio sp.]